MPRAANGGQIDKIHGNHRYAAQKSMGWGVSGKQVEDGKGIRCRK